MPARFHFIAWPDQDAAIPHPTDVNIDFAVIDFPEDVLCDHSRTGIAPHSNYCLSKTKVLVKAFPSVFVPLVVVVIIFLQRSQISGDVTPAFSSSWS